MLSERFWTAVLSPIHEHLHHFRVVMVEEEALAGVEFGNLRHILVAECEVKDVKILLHALNMHRFRNDDHSAGSHSAA